MAQRTSTTAVEPADAPPPDCRALFSAFCEMSVFGFGGVLPWARRVLVDRRGWMTDLEFAELLSLGQILPGPNICNVAVMLGYRYRGWRGSLAAVGGLMGVPFMTVLALGVAYRHLGQFPLVQGALRGMGAVAAGLILGTAVKLAQAQPRTVRALIFGVLALVTVGILQWPMGGTMAVLIPGALAIETLAWRRRR